MRVMWHRVVLVILILAGSAWGIYQSDWVQKKIQYPFYYQDIIYLQALEYNVSPHFIAAVIRAESKFSPKARSPKGAIGLMQIMPATAAWIASQMSIAPPSASDLENPELNIRMGSWYLRDLMNEFKGNEVLVLAAYNGGRGNVREWMGRYGWDWTFADVDQISFGETRDFIKRVQKNRYNYQQLYGR